MEFSFAICKNELIMCFKGSVVRNNKKNFAHFAPQEPFIKMPRCNRENVDSLVVGGFLLGVTSDDTK